MSAFFTLIRGAITLTLSLLITLPIPSFGTEDKKENGASGLKAEVGNESEITGQPVQKKIVREGVEIEFSVEPLSQKEVRESEISTIKFRVKDATIGTPLTGLRPAAWLDLERTPGGGKFGAPTSCREKIQLYMQGSMGYRPDLDLNSYYILSLNNDASISVTDPIVSFQGVTALYTMIRLKKPGEDWVSTFDDKQLFVTMPEADAVAVVNTESFKVVKDVAVGSNPVRIALQPDQRFIWVGNDGRDRAAGSVTVLDPVKLEVVATIPVGLGHHEIAFSDDSLYAYVTNKEDGTLSIIDVQKMQKVKDLQVGKGPVAVTFSSLGKAAYVADEEDGLVAVVDGKAHEVVHRIEMKAGLRALRFAPDGRMGFVVNAKENVVQIFDASTNGIIRTVETGKGPDKIAFSKDFGYIQSRGSEMVTLVPLKDLLKEGTLATVKVPGGQSPPDTSPHYSIADAIVPTPEGGHVLIANPADRTIYYYMEGMNFSMGSFRSYGGTVQRAVRVVDRSMRETEQGVYSSKVKIPASGKYQLAFLLDNPLILECFEFSAGKNPALAMKDKGIPKLELLTEERTLAVGEELKLRFRMTDSSGNESMEGIKDIVAMMSLVGGNWNDRYTAQDMGGGVYEVNLRAPEEGVYYVVFACPSLKANFDKFPQLAIQATKQKGAL